MCGHISPVGHFVKAIEVHGQIVEAVSTCDDIACLRAMKVRFRVRSFEACKGLTLTSSFQLFPFRKEKLAKAITRGVCQLAPRPCPYELCCKEQKWNVKQDFSGMARVYFTKKRGVFRAACPNVSGSTMFLAFTGRCLSRFLTRPQECCILLSCVLLLDFRVPCGSCEGWCCDLQEC